MSRCKKGLFNRTTVKHVAETDKFMHISKAEMLIANDFLQKLFLFFLKSGVKHLCLTETHSSQNSSKTVNNDKVSNFIFFHIVSQKASLQNTCVSHFHRNASLILCAYSEICSFNDTK